MEKFFFSRSRSQTPVPYSTSDRSTELVRQNLKKLVKAIFDCEQIRRIELNQFAILYQEFFGKEPNHRDRRMRDLKLFLQEEADDVLIIKEQHGKIYVFPKFENIQPNLDQNFLSPIPEEKITIPDYVLGPGETLKTLDLNRYLHFGRTIILSVSCNTSNSVVYARLNANSEYYKFFLGKFQAFYRTQEDRLWMPDHVMTKGQFCAVLVDEGPGYPKKWQRGKIDSARDHRASVFLVDEGAVIETDKSLIRYLHKRYDGLPMQALQITTRH